MKIYRLICKNTYEREMFDKASLKLGLDKAVLQSMGSNKQGEVANINVCAVLLIRFVKCFGHTSRVRSFFIVLPAV